MFLFTFKSIMNLLKKNLNRFDDVDAQNNFFKSENSGMINDSFYGYYEVFNNK